MFTMPTLPEQPRSLTVSNFDDRLNPDAIVLDLTSLNFVDAYGLVATACALEVARSEAPGFRVLGPRNRKLGGHLTFMGFRHLLERFDLEGQLPEKPVADSSDVVVPLQSAKGAGGEEKLSRILWGQLRDHVDPQVLEALAEGVSEMVANALEHSGSDAQVMAQVYTTPIGQPPDHDNRVQVVIGDIGRGIRSSFQSTGAYDAADDRAAIDHALEYLATSVVDDPGRGQGLSTTMEQVAGLRGTMIVRSDTARVAIDAGGRHWSEVAPIPGVVVCMSLPLHPGEHP